MRLKRLYTIENLAFTIEIKYDHTIYDDSDVDYLSNQNWNYERTFTGIKELTDESIRNNNGYFKFMELGKMIEKLTDEIFLLVRIWV